MHALTSAVVHGVMPALLLAAVIDTEARNYDGNTIRWAAQPREDRVRPDALAVHRIRVHAAEFPRGSQHLVVAAQRCGARHAGLGHADRGARARGRSLARRHDGDL